METMKPHQFFSLFLFLCLTACTSASSSFVPAGTVEMTNAIPATSTPISTVTAEPTRTLTPDIPIPSGLLSIPEGYSAVHNADSWGYGAKNGTEVVPIPNLTVDASGAHFAFNGNSVDIPASALGERIKVGQAGALQIYNEQKTGIDFAWDRVESRWIKSADIIQPDGNTIENFIQVNSEDELKRELRLEEMFLIPFAPDTYWPEQDKIKLDYDNKPHPLGELSDLSKAPTRMDVNHIRWGDIIFITEQIYNAGNKSFSRLHFTDTVVLYPKDYLELAARYASIGAFVLPSYKFTSETERDRVQKYMGPVMDLLVKGGYYIPGALDMPKIKALMQQGLQSGVFSDELEEIPFLWGTYGY
jgi:hypothetical protein